MKKKVLIIGGGITGLSCAKLLSLYGWKVEIWGGPSLHKPPVVINDSTRDLLDEIWKLPDLWSDAFPLKERKIIWGKTSTITTIEQPSVSIQATELIRRLYCELNSQTSCGIHFKDNTNNLQILLRQGNLNKLNQEFSWIIDAGGRKSQLSQLISNKKHILFGKRQVISTKVELTGNSNRDVNWMETVKSGWLFLAPLSQQTALLQAMIPEIAGCPLTTLLELLKKTKWIKEQIDPKLDTQPVLFNAAPSISLPLCGEKWISIGDAACSFDPICGDGIGYALREIFLATAIINGAETEFPVDEVLNHFSMRLHKTFYSHIDQCIKYYSEGFDYSISWKDEIENMRNTLQNYTNKLPLRNHFNYQLRGAKLVKL